MRSLHAAPRRGGGSKAHRRWSAAGSWWARFTVVLLGSGHLGRRREKPMADGGARHGSEVDSITRRQALRQGALIGTAVVWSTPLVQAVTISPAAAQSTSPPATTTTSSTSTSTTTSTTSTSTSTTS